MEYAGFVRHWPTSICKNKYKKRSANPSHEIHFLAREIDAWLPKSIQSIPHHKLIQDIKKYYDDPKVQAMLEEVITNPIETPRGYKNPTTGIALRGPLSQFFSAIYLKPLDDALSQMDIVYIRYQDDLIALCKSKRQLNRCRRKMMEILHERHLKLSRKKSRIGSISKGFHFLGIDYPGTQPQDYTKVTRAVNDNTIHTDKNENILITSGGGYILNKFSLCHSVSFLMQERFERPASK